ncbi:cyclic-di-AMP receptor [Bacillus kwashiorkori]|uniref:cyclic-di-AMP receptor n=1 Tax=Bacillus kwashiorkori TaxID=1522318 RepID=UPI000783443C|nr:cyclic-di-AMP receptor [Bacillus kwashiorkori]
MKLIIAIIQKQDSSALMKALVAQNIQATKLSSTGGFLRSGNTTFLIGAKEGRVDEVLRIIEQTGKKRVKEAPPISPLGGSVEQFLPNPHQVMVGGATVFVLPIEQFNR